MNAPTLPAWCLYGNIKQAKPFFFFLFFFKKNPTQFQGLELFSEGLLTVPEMFLSLFGEALKNK